MSFFENMAKENIGISDEVIAKNLIASATGAANAYLNALMTSTTPEVRAIYSSSLSQIITGHSALTELMMNREWGDPYIEPREQLSNIYEKVRISMEEIRQ